jgi:hypothetical protein
MDIRDKLRADLIILGGQIGLTNTQLFEIQSWFYEKFIDLGTVVRVERRIAEDPAFAEVYMRDIQSRTLQMLAKELTSKPEFLNKQTFSGPYQGEIKYQALVYKGGNGE